MKKLTFLITAFLFINCLSFAQSPDILWSKSFGGSSDERAYSICQTSDGGYVLAGYTRSNDYDVSGNHGNYDYWIVKLDNLGDTTWTKTLGGSSNDEAHSICQTSDGGYVLAGYTESNDGDVSGNHGGYDYWVVKLNSSGDTTWTKTLGGSGDDRAFSICQTSDGGYVAAGRTYSNNYDVSGNHGGYDYWVVKLDNLGDTTWTKTLGGSSNDYARSICQTLDGGYIVAGYAKSNNYDVSGNHGSFDYWVVKLNSSGDTTWTKTLGGSSADYARSICQTSDGGYVLAGYTRSNNYDVSGNHGKNDYWVVKLNSSGDTIWTKTLGGLSNEYAHSICQITDGGYVVDGYTFIDGNDGDLNGGYGGADTWIVKLNSSGDTTWTKILGGSNSDYTRSICQTSDGGYVVAGETYSNDYDVSGNHGSGDFWVLKLEGDPCIAPTDLIASNFSSTTAELSWTENGSVTSWQIRLDIAGFDTTGIVPVTVSENPFTWSELSPETEYEWYVRAVCDDGDYSEWVGSSIFKTLSEGIVWAKCFGGSSGEQATSIQPTIDGGYIIAGYTYSDDGDVNGNNGNWDYWIVKLNSSGDTTWTKTLGGSNDDRAHSIIQSQEGGFIVAGSSNSTDGDVYGNHGRHDYWIVKLDTLGNIKWSKTLGGTADDIAKSIIQSTEGSYLVTGWSASTDGDAIGGDKFGDYWVVKIDTLGNIIWSKTFGGSSSDYAKTIIESSDGGYVIAGQSGSDDNDVFGNHGNFDFWILKINNEGGILWSKSLGGSGYDAPISIDKTLDGGCILAGYTDSDDGDVYGLHSWPMARIYDYWIVKLDEQGDTCWTKTLGGYDYDVASSIIQKSNGEYVVAGSSSSTDGDVNGNNGNYDYWIVKLDEQGDTCWTKTLGGYDGDVASSIIQKSNGEYVVAGSSSSTDGDVYGNHGGGDFWIVKLEGDAMNPVTLPFTENWETYSGTRQEDGGIHTAPSYRWNFTTSLPGEGRAQWGTDAFLAHRGSGALTLDRNPSEQGNYAINSADLTLNLSNYEESSNLELSFWWADHGDEDHTNDKVWVRGSDTDPWLMIYDLAPAAATNGTYQYVGGLDIDAVLAASSQSVSSTFQIRFGQEDDYNTDWDGISYDDIVIEETSPGFFTDSNQELGTFGHTDVALGDMDGDGDIDAVVTKWGHNYLGQPNKVWLNDGSGNFTDSGLSLGSEWSRAIALGDLDGDGDLDGFVANSGPNKVYLNNGNLTTSNGQDLGDLASMDVVLGDIDGDGDLDAVIANPHRYHQGTIYLNKGNGQFFDSGLSFLGYHSSWGIALGDLDQDGDLDGFEANDGGNRAFLNEGPTTTFNGQYYGLSSSQDVQLGDMDGDGDLDAVVANAGGGSNKVWLNNGDGTFVVFNTDLGYGISTGVALGDLDGDGDLDGFVANIGPNKIYLNDGLNTTDNGQLLGNSESYGVALADLDGDGDLDAFVANHNGPCKVWFNRSPHQTEKQAEDKNLSQFSLNSFEEQKEVLLENYPNPFDRATTIRFKLNTKGRVVLRIANLYGKVVEQLYDATAEAEQEYKLEFQAGDLPAGIYVIQLESENGLKAHSKMMLLK